MILLADIGNTTCSVFLSSGKNNELIPSGKVLTGGNVFFGRDFSDIVQKLAETSEIKQAVISSVVSELTEIAADVIKQGTGITPMLVSSECTLNFTLNSETSATVGADRLCDLAYAAEELKLPAVTVDFGTATTLNVLTKDGFFAGGVIAAGAATSLNALFEKTSKLPRVVLKAPDSVIGKNTVDNMLAGAIMGQASMVDGLVKMVEEEIGEEVSLALTGGYASLIIPYIRHLYVFVEDMVPKGMLILAKKEQLA